VGCLRTRRCGTARSGRRRKATGPVPLSSCSSENPGAARVAAPTTLRSVRRSIGGESDRQTEPSHLRPRSARNQGRSRTSSTTARTPSPSRRVWLTPQDYLATDQRQVACKHQTSACHDLDRRAGTLLLTRHEHLGPADERRATRGLQGTRRRRSRPGLVGRVSGDNCDRGRGLGRALPSCSRSTHGEVARVAPSVRKHQRERAPSAPGS